MRVGVEASFSWIPIGLVLASPDGVLGEVDEEGSGADAGGGVPAGTIGSRPTTQVVDVDADGQATLALAVPAGKGWTAVADGRELPTLTVDGWAQAWQVPEGVDRVTVRYASGEVLRWAAGLAVSGWALVVVLALWSSAGDGRGARAGGAVAPRRWSGAPPRRRSQRRAGSRSPAPTRVATAARPPRRGT